MDDSETSWISELGLEDSFFSGQCDMLDFLEEDLSASLLGEDMQNSWSQEFINSSSSTLMPRSDSTTSLCTSCPMDSPHIGMEMVETQPNPDSQTTDNNMAPSPMILTFGNVKAPKMNAQHVSIGMLNPEHEAVSEVLISSCGSDINLEEAAKKAHSTKKTPRSRPASQTYDHIIAERKRREQLSQQFVALSAIVPGLKKMDKTSVLGDAINYLKQLQERVKKLEEKTSKQTVESLVIVKRTQLFLEEEGSSDDQGLHDEQHLPEIEAKLCDKNVLLRIQCEKHRGVLVKILSVMHKFDMAVINTNVTPFGTLALDITIVAEFHVLEVDKELKLTMKELVKSLRSALKRRLE